MGHGVESGITGMKVFRDPTDECGRHKKRKQANHPEVSVDHSKTLEKRKEACSKKPKEYTFSSGRMSKNPDYLGLTSWYTFVAFILNTTKHSLT